MFVAGLWGETRPGPIPRVRGLPAARGQRSTFSDVRRFWGLRSRGEAARGKLQKKKEET